MTLTDKIMALEAALIAVRKDPDIEIQDLELVMALTVAHEHISEVCEEVCSVVYFDYREYRAAQKKAVIELASNPDVFNLEGKC